MEQKPERGRGGLADRLPLWAWIVGPAFLVIAVVVVLSLFWQGGGTEGFDDPEAGVTLYDIVENPREYYGSTVTVRGEVSQILGPNALLIVEPFGVSADDLLVISSVPLSEALPGDVPSFEDEAIRVTGEVREFDLTEVEQEIGADLDEELLDYRVGTPSIVAASISLEPASDGEEGAPVTPPDEG